MVLLYIVKACYKQVLFVAGSAYSIVKLSLQE